MTSQFIAQNNKVLELNTRKRIYYLVKKYAGCHFRDIERKSKIPASSLKYHLNYLTKHKLILEEKDGNNLRFFPKEFNTSNKVLLGFLRQDSIRKILIFLLINGKSNHEGIVRFVNLSPSTVSWHLKKLLSKSVIKANKDGRTTKYNLSIDKNEIMNLLITYQESFLDSLVNKAVEMWEID